MELIFKFLDKEEWSVHGTLRTAIPFLLLIIMKLKIDALTLIFISLMGMMKGDIISKILFVGFLNFLVFEPTKEWIIKSIIYVISIILMNYVKYGNKIEKTILNSNIYMVLFRLLIIGWMCYILYLIIYPLSKWKKLINV